MELMSRQHITGNLAKVVLTPYKSIYNVSLLNILFSITWSLSQPGNCRGCFCI